MFKLFKIIRSPKKTSLTQPLQCSTCPHENELMIYFENRAVMRITRRSCTFPHNELSAFIPRAEIRKRRYENGKVVAEEELILNSITIIDSIRHELECGTGK